MSSALMIFGSGGRFAIILSLVFCLFAQSFQRACVRRQQRLHAGPASFDRLRMRNNENGTNRMGPRRKSLILSPELGEGSKDAPTAMQRPSPAASPRQVGPAHEEFVDGACALAAFADGPDDQRPATPAGAAGEHLGHR